MMIVLLLATLFLLLVWQLGKVIYTNCQNQQLLLAEKQIESYAPQNEFAVMLEKNHDTLNFYNGLGHSIAALHIQLQVAQKLWQINPTQAQESLLEAYQLSSTLMQEVRQVVRILSQDSFK